MDLFIFQRQLELDRQAIEAGAKAIVVDLEKTDKHRRQQDFDTQINEHHIANIYVRTEANIPTITRINGFGPSSETEIQQVLDAGTMEILVPMVRGLAEVDSILKWVDGRVKVGVMIETPEAIGLAPLLARYDLARAFVGLNDLTICLGRQSIFELLHEGIVEQIRQLMPHTPFGFGGLTLPWKGYPLPATYFFHELHRLDCSFTFLRRSFFRDTHGSEIASAIRTIRNYQQQVANRSKHQIYQQQQQDEKLLLEVVEPHSSLLQTAITG